MLSLLEGYKQSKSVLGCSDRGLDCNNPEDTIKGVLLNKRSRFYQSEELFQRYSTVISPLLVDQGSIDTMTMISVSRGA